MPCRPCDGLIVFIRITVNRSFPSDIRRTRAGFTLLELLLVVVISGVVLAMSSGKIHSLIVQQRVARAATAVQNDLEAAFAIAGRSRQPIRIIWDSADQQLLIANHAATTFYRKTTLSQATYGLSPSAFTLNRDTVDVYPNGLSNDQLVITIKDASDTTAKRTVTMLRGGIVKVEAK